MALDLVNVRFDADDPERLAAFWADALGWEVAGHADDEVRVRSTDGTRFGLRFVATSTPKTTKNPIHLDLLGESPDDQRVVVDRLLGLGARPVDIGQTGDETWTVLADPEGNELCVVRRGEFLAELGLLNTRTALVLLYTAYQLPIVVWVLFGFFQTLPHELERAALIDGYTRFQALIKIVLPLSKTGLVAAGLFVLTFAWNDFVVALVMTSSDEIRTLPIAIYNYLGYYGREWGPLTASAIAPL